MWTYPIKLVKDDNGTYLATSPDFPELVTYGDTPTKALENARGAIEEAIAARMSQRDDIPRPSKNGRHRTGIPTQTVFKILLYDAMRQRGISKAGLAVKLKMHRPQVDRLLNVRRTSKLETLDEAFKAMGCRVRVDLVKDDAA